MAHFPDLLLHYNGWGGRKAYWLFPCAAKFWLLLQKLPNKRRQTVYLPSAAMQTWICMKITTFTVGRLSTNCYVVNCQETQEAIVIDPGLDYSSEAEHIFRYVEEHGLKVKFIVNTHGHPDHIRGDGVFKKKYGAPVCIHAKDSHLIRGTDADGPPPSVLLKDGDVLRFGNVVLKVLHTPGHTLGGVSLVGENLVFTGDTLFAGSIGRTDFPEGSDGDMRLSLKKLLLLPDFFAVYPGHGAASTIGVERRVNPFLQWL
jgi:hydroxyacylglutathione hydrolase